MEQCIQGDRVALELHHVPGAGAWLVLFGRDADLVRTGLQHLLWIPFLDQDSQCPLCGKVLDRFCDHAVCPCAGDRNLRYNAIPPRLLRSRP